jgi:hypothetical protein
MPADSTRFTRVDRLVDALEVWVDLRASSRGAQLVGVDPTQNDEMADRAKSLVRVCLLELLEAVDVDHDPAH